MQEFLREDAGAGEALLSATMVAWPAAGAGISLLLARHGRALAEYDAGYDVEDRG